MANDKPTKKTMEKLRAYILKEQQIELSEQTKTPVKEKKKEDNNGK